MLSDRLFAASSILFRDTNGNENELFGRILAGARDICDGRVVSGDAFVVARPLARNKQIRIKSQNAACRTARNILL